MGKVLELATRGYFLGYPSPLHIYPASQVEKAFRYMQCGKNTGRIIVSVEGTDVVPVSSNLGSLHLMRTASIPDG